MFCLFMPLMTARAQYRFDSWMTGDGLPQNSVYEIIQTRDGYLWLATADGLARFDGVRFTVFNKANTAGIKSNRFIALFEDAGGAIWATTDNSGVTRLSKAVAKTFTTADGLPFNNVRGITGDADGNIWVLSGEQILRFDGAGFLPADLNGLHAKFNNSQWNKGGFFAAKDDILYRFEKGVLTAQKFERAFLERLSYRFEEDANKILWATTKDGKIARIENGAKAKIFDVAKFVSGRIGESLQFAEMNFDFQTGGGERFNVKFNVDFNRSLTLLSSGKPQTILFRAMKEDREGNLWLGTDVQGLVRVRRQFIKVYSKADGLADKNVYAVFQTNDKAIWIGAWTGGVSRLADGKFTNFSDKDGLASNLPLAIYEDRRGTLWTSAHNDGDGGLRVFKNSKFEKPAPYPNLPERSVVAAIYETSDGAFWFGTSVGLARFQNGETTLFANQKGLGEAVKAIIESKSGGLWIASAGGVTRFQNGELKNYTEADGLPSDNVRALYEDADGVLWIGTYDGGLGRFKDGKFTKFTAENGLFDNGVFQILEDDGGNLWMSSNRGIHRARKPDLNDFADGRVKNFNSTGYGASDGLLNIECNGGVQTAGIKANDGRLWFPTQDGVAVIDPKAVIFNPNPPRVLIETVKIDGVLSNPPASAGGSDIELQSNQRNLEIGYTGLTFTKPEQVHFRYKLEGLNEEWTDAGERRTAFYPYLPPGKYTFRVIAANSDNVWNEQGAGLEIVVKPAFYQTWWFLVLCALAIGFGAFLIYRRRLNEINRRRLAQEDFSRRLINAHETERRRVAAELHDSIGQSLAMIKNSAVFGSQTASDLTEAKEQLAEISTQSAQAISEVREIAYNLRPFMLDRLGLTKAVSSLLNKIADNSALNINSEIEDVDGLFENEAEISIYRIIQESLNNILKHSEATKVKVSITKTERAVSIKIQDNGKGFDVKAKSETKQRGGFGLLGMSERVRLLGGTILIESELLKGTILVINLDREKGRRGEGEIGR